MSVGEARAILGPKPIIGGTANSFADALSLLQQPIDYIGLGPFRFTNTKAQLAPVMGLSGIADIIKAMPIAIPIIAIGGITIADIETLMGSGVYGIAVSSAINLATKPTAITQEFIAKLK
jgi:thiamine-phosphate pyrophosphorylase